MIVSSASTVVAQKRVNAETITLLRKSLIVNFSLGAMKWTLQEVFFIFMSKVQDPTC